MTPRQVLPYRMSQAEYRDPDFHRAQLEVRRRMRRWARRERMKRWLLSRETWIAAVALVGAVVALLYAFDAEGAGLQGARAIDGCAAGEILYSDGGRLRCGALSYAQAPADAQPSLTRLPVGLAPRGPERGDSGLYSYTRSWLFKGLLFCLILTGCLIVLEAVREFLLDDEDLGGVSPRREWR